jgi:hypothetical protein
MENFLFNCLEENSGFGIKTCSTGIEIPTLTTDPCNGCTTSAQCVKDATLYPELNLPENSSQKEINQALYLAFLSLKAQIESI